MGVDGGHGGLPVKRLGISSRACDVAFMRHDCCGAMCAGDLLQALMTCEEKCALWRRALACLAFFFSPQPVAAQIAYTAALVRSMSCQCKQGAV